MKLSQFKFDLPPGLIAQHPKENRDESRLMVVHKDSGKIEHKVFKDILDYVDQGDALITNNTKVFPARLYGHKEKTGADVEVFLLRELNKELSLWDTMVEPARKIRIGNKLYFGEGDLTAEIVDNTTSRGRTVRFLFDGTNEELHKAIDELGEMPLPRELQREAEPEDRENFQTIFADKVGAVAAPAAGLHFTPHLLKRLELKGVDLGSITLHLGIGSFRSIEVEDLGKHKMDSENFTIPKAAATLVNQKLEDKKRVVAVGTTVLRTLEYSVSVGGLLKANEGWNDMFLLPPCDFKICNALVSNLHLPKSILLINVCAFGGYELVMEAYQTAIEEEYRFFTYGDAMLII